MMVTRLRSTTHLFSVRRVMSGSCWVSDIRGRMLAREPGAAKRCLPRLLHLPKLCPRQPLPPARLELGLCGFE
jgi:hypothetical protein